MSPTGHEGMHSFLAVAASPQRFSQAYGLVSGSMMGNKALLYSSPANSTEPAYLPLSHSLGPRFDNDPYPPTSWGPSEPHPPVPALGS